MGSQGYPVDQEAEVSGRESRRLDVNEDSAEFSGGLRDGWIEGKRNRKRQEKIQGEGEKAGDTFRRGQGLPATPANFREDHGKRLL